MKVKLDNNRVTEGKRSEPSESLYKHSNLHGNELFHMKHNSFKFTVNEFSHQLSYTPFASVLYTLSALFMLLMHFLCLFIFFSLSQSISSSLSLSLWLIFLYNTSLCKWCVFTFGCLATHTLPQPCSLTEGQIHVEGRPGCFSDGQVAVIYWVLYVCVCVRARCWMDRFGIHQDS